MVRRCSKKRYLAPRAATAVRHARTQRLATVWKAKASRLRLTRVFLPWPKLCSRLSPPVLRTLKVSFSIFHLARPHAAKSDVGRGRGPAIRALVPGGELAEAGSPHVPGGDKGEREPFGKPDRRRHVGSAAQLDFADLGRIAGDADQ